MKYTKASYIFLVSIVCITDVPRYRAFSPVFIYSVCLYVVVNILSFCSAKGIVLHLYKKNDNISDTVFNILLIVMLVNCIGVPVLAWIDTPKFVQYLHKWEKYQVGSNWEFLEFGFNWKYIFDLSFFCSTRYKICKSFTRDMFFIF
jgi:hypothetical protein